MRSSLLELLAPSVCPACDVPRRPGTRRLCGRCRVQLTPLRELRGVRTALAYDGTGARLVQRFKFEGRRDALDILIEPLVERVRELHVDSIVPVPRHQQRVRELGADPVYELARALARRVKLPLRQDVLLRSRPTRPQTGLPPRARRTNVAGSFAARPGALRGRRALLLDDVITTGATLSAAAAELRRSAGPRSVVPLALAGTPTLPSAGWPAL
jgi:ComF family protein